MGMKVNSISEDTDFQLGNPESRCLSTQYVDADKTMHDDSVAFVKNLNEIIPIEESQSTQELFRHISNIKKELKNQTSSDFPTLPNSIKNVAEVQSFDIECPDCEEVNTFILLYKSKYLKNEMNIVIYLVIIVS